MSGMGLFPSVSRAGYIEKNYIISLVTLVTGMGRVAFNYSLITLSPADDENFVSTSSLLTID